MHKQVPCQLHVHFNFKWYQLAFPLKFGPHMRLYRPMHGGPKASCTRVLHLLESISAISTLSCSFKIQPQGNLKLCWNQNPTILKGILIFIFLIQAWISKKSVDLQDLLLSLTFISHLKIKLEAKVGRNRADQICSSKVYDPTVLIWISSYNVNFLCSNGFLKSSCKRQASGGFDFMF
jgi:hypothetical protein